MRRAVPIGVLCLLTCLTPCAQAGTLPRESPEFAISEPGRPTVFLSGFRGKVVVMEFLFIRSEHCLRVARMLNSLYGQLGPRGFQPVGVVFDPPNTVGSGADLIGMMTNYFKLAYPVGYTSRDAVDRYLNRAPREILNIPQVVVIDRAGTIRASTGGGNLTLEEEGSLRALIESLLKEGAPAESNRK